jgi:hypothetical protein
VGPDVALGVELWRLGDSAQTDDFGKDLGQEAEVEEQRKAAVRATLGEDSGELVADAFCADLGDLCGVAADGGGCDGIDLEVETGGKTDSTQHAELIFGEAKARIADGADDAGGEVIAAVDEVDGGGGGVAGSVVGEGIEEQAIDGEVAAEDIFAGVGGEANGVGTAAIGVGAVVAEGGNFSDDVLFIEWLADKDDAEVRAHGEGFGEERDDLAWSGGGGDIEVHGRDAQQQIAHAAAGEEGLVTRFAQTADEVEGGDVVRVRWIHLALPPLLTLDSYSLVLHGTAGGDGLSLSRVSRIEVCPMKRVAMLAFIVLCLCVQALTAQQTPAVRPGAVPPDVPIKAPDPSFPLRVHLLTAKFGGISGVYHGYGSGNLMGANATLGFDYGFACDVPFVPNASERDVYQARWTDSQYGLELLMAEAGVEQPREHTCTLRLAVKKQPFEPANTAALTHGVSYSLRKRWQDPDFAYEETQLDYPLHFHVVDGQRTEDDKDDHGWGTANLSDPAERTQQGAEFSYNCTYGFLTNSQITGYYQARWVKTGSELEVILQRPGTDKVDKCSVAVTLKAQKYPESHHITVNTQASSGGTRRPGTATP